MKLNNDWVRGLISVVMPSRKRGAGLVRAWDSCRRNALGGTDRLELCVAYDADDPNTRDTATLLAAKVIVEFPERLFWDGNNVYFAELFKRARGEWIMPFGDDGEMLSLGWDTIVRLAPTGVLYVHGGIHGHNVFPIVHRSVLEALPWEICPSPHQDTWLTDVAAGAAILHTTDIHVREHRELDETRPIQRFRYRTEEYYSGDFAELRQQDVRALVKAFP